MRALNRPPGLFPMFNLIGIGECAGSGIPGLREAWLRHYQRDIVLTARFDPARLALSLALPMAGQPQTGDKAYIHPQTGDKSNDKAANQPQNGDKTSDKKQKGDKLRTSDKPPDQLTITKS